MDTGLGSLVVSSVDESVVVGIDLDTTSQGSRVSHEVSGPCLARVGVDLGVGSSVLVIVLREVGPVGARRLEGLQVLGDVVRGWNRHLVVTVAVFEDVLVVVDVEAGWVTVGLDCACRGDGWGSCGCCCGGGGG